MSAWTDRPPTTPGWYWVQTTTGDLEIVYWNDSPDAPFADGTTSYTMRIGDEQTCGVADVIAWAPAIPPQVPARSPR